MVALYSFFSAREAWVRMARAREYLKKKQKKTWRRHFYRESRSTYRSPFCPEQIFIEKRLEICLKIHFFRLLLT